MIEELPAICAGILAYTEARVRWERRQAGRGAGAVDGPGSEG